MLVCHCNGVTDRTVRKAIRKGAATPVQVAHMTGAGACCGGCVDTVVELIHRESARSEASAPATSPSSQQASI